MKVKEMLALIANRLSNLSINTNTDIILPYLNMGVSELYKRYGLSIREEVIPTCTAKRLYELHNDDVLFLYSVYDSSGKEIPQLDTYDDRGLHYKQVNYRSFLLTESFEGMVYCIYKAAPERLEDENDEIDVPDPMLDVLENYVTYKVLSILNGDQLHGQETFSYRQITEQLMKDLDDQGYGAMAQTERFSLHRKGFV